MIQFVQFREQPLAEEYQVCAVDRLTEAVSEITNLPEAPSILHVIDGEVVWAAAAGATGYRVEKSTGTLWTVAATLGNVLIYSNGSVTGPAYYRVRASNAAGLGPPSSTMFLE